MKNFFCKEGKSEFMFYKILCYKILTINAFLLKIIKYHAVNTIVSKTIGDQIMAIEFNKLARKFDYNFAIGQENGKKAVEKKDEVVKNETKSAFKGLENETDLLTKNVQNLYGIHFGKISEDKEIANETNKILASLGFDFKVSEKDVKSVANGVKDVVLPGLKLAEDGAVAAHIADPDGPFADLFA